MNRSTVTPRSRISRNLSVIEGLRAFSADDWIWSRFSVSSGFASSGISLISPLVKGFLRWHWKRTAQRPKQMARRKEWNTPRQGVTLFALGEPHRVPFRVGIGTLAAEPGCRTFLGPFPSRPSLCFQRIRSSDSFNN